VVIDRRERIDPLLDHNLADRCKKECVMFRTEAVRFPAEGCITASNLWPKPSEAGFVVLLHEQRHRR